MPSRWPARRGATLAGLVAIEAVWPSALELVARHAGRPGAGGRGFGWRGGADRGGHRRRATQATPAMAALVGGRPAVVATEPGPRGVSGTCVSGSAESIAA